MEADALASTPGGGTQPDASTPEEVGGTQTDAVDEDGGEEDAASPEPEVWGRLLSAVDSAVLLLLSRVEMEYTIGRGASCALRLTSSRVSTSHARLLRGEGAHGPPILEDSSTNGVWVNGAKVGKGNRRALKHLDEIAFIAPGSDTMADTTHRVIFFSPSATGVAATAPSAPSPAPAEAGSGASGAMVHGAASASDTAASGGSGADPSGDDYSAVEKELMCGICQDLMYKPVALQPCMHAFCGACFSEWMQRKAICPQCREPVRVVSRNHAIGNIISGFLERHPEKARDPQELARLDAEDTLGNAPRAIRKRERDEGAEFAELSDDDGSDDDGSLSDDDGYPHGMLLPAAMLAMARGHAARRDQAMLRDQMMPCSVCRMPRPSAIMAPLRGRTPLLSLPPRALGNNFERSALMSYLRTNDLTLNSLLDACLDRTAAGTSQVKSSRVERLSTLSPST